MADDIETLTSDLLSLGMRAAAAKGAPPLVGPIVLMCLAFNVARSSAPRATDDMLDALQNIRPDERWDENSMVQDALINWTRQTIARAANG